MSSTKISTSQMDSEDEFIASLPTQYRISTPVKPNLKRHPNQGMCLCEGDEIEEGPSESILVDESQNLVEMPDDNVLESFILEYNWK